MYHETDAERQRVGQHGQPEGEWSPEPAPEHPDVQQALHGHHCQLGQHHTEHAPAVVQGRCHDEPQQGVGQQVGQRSSLDRPPPPGTHAPGDHQHHRHLDGESESQIGGVRHDLQYCPTGLAPASGAAFTLAFVVAPPLALTLAVAAPVPLAVGAVAVFGVAHLGLETRYVIGRFSTTVRWQALAWLVVPLTLIAAVRLARLGPAGTRIEATIALALVVGAWAWCTRGRWAALAIGLLALAGVAVPALRHPEWYAVAVAHLHNLTPLAFLWEWSRERGTRAGRALFRLTQLGWAVVVPTVVLLGAFDRDGWGWAWAADRTPAKVAAVYSPAGWGGQWPLRFLTVFCFGQLMHYVIWCGFLPAVARREHRAAGSVGAFGPLLRPRLFVPLLAGTALSIGLLQLLAGPDGRRIYAAVASYHAYLEYPLLALMTASLVGIGVGRTVQRSSP